MNFDLRKRTILLTVAGSHAYGLDTDESDVDLKGVCIPPQKYRDGFLHRFEQADKKEHAKQFFDLLPSKLKDAAERNGYDCTVYDLAKFMKLAADANPNILDVLFCVGGELRQNVFGQMLRQYRHKFLSKKVLYTFRGYAIAQLKRIQTHRKWILTPVEREPQRADFGLPLLPQMPTSQLTTALVEIRKKMDSWAVDYGLLDEAGKIHAQDCIARYLAELEMSKDDQWRAAGKLIGYDDNLLDLLYRERLYNDAHSDWEKYQIWKKTRNPKRAEIERKFGFDCKHASHLYRLLRMCREILTEGKVLVRRPDAAELLAIRNGALTYEQVLEFAQKEDVELVELAKKSTLPHSPDREWLDDLCCAITREYEQTFL